MSFFIFWGLFPVTVWLVRLKSVAHNSYYRTVWNIFTSIKFFSDHPGLQHQMGESRNLQWKLNKKAPALMENLLRLVEEEKKSLEVHFSKDRLLHYWGYVFDHSILLLIIHLEWCGGFLWGLRATLESRQMLLQIPSKNKYYKQTYTTSPLKKTTQNLWLSLWGLCKDAYNISHMPHCLQALSIALVRCRSTTWQVPGQHFENSSF